MFDKGRTERTIFEACKATTKFDAVEMKFLPELDSLFK